MFKTAAYKWVAPLVLSLCLCVVVFSTLDDYGVAWDEGYFIYSGIMRLDWLKKPSVATIDQYWGAVHVHPPFSQVIAGITEDIFNQKLHLLDRITASRVSVVIFVFFLTYALFSFARELYGGRVAFLVTISFYVLPRVFYHAHLITLDYPMTAMWFLVVYTYWRGFKNGRWVLLSSILLGLALLTKINAPFLYIPILLSWLFYYRGQIARLLAGKRRPDGHEVRGMLWRILPMLVVPPVVFIAFWPWLWKDTLHRLIEYFSFHLHHADIPVYYFGEQYYSAPWHYPFVLTFITVPLVVLIPLFIGILAIGTRQNRATNIFILFNALFPLLVISMQVAKYDGVRLFLPAFPFICMIAGLGLSRILVWAQKVKMDRYAFYGYLLLLAVTVYFSIVRIHPYQSSYFNAAIGGVSGADKKGFEPEYWGNAYIGLLSWMNEHPNNTYWIYMTEKDPNIYLNIRLYKESGMLHPGTGFGPKAVSDYLVLLIRQGMFDDEMWEYYGNKEPVYSVRLSGVELANIYKLK